MSDVQTLLAKCRDLGATFAPLPDGKLKVRAPGPLPDTLRQELKQRKAEILAALRSPSLPPQKPQKPVFAVSAGRHARGTEKILPATRPSQRSVSPPAQPPHEGEPSTQTNELPADLPALDAWLCDCHPGLWRQIRKIDTELSTAALTSESYQQQLAILLQLYQQARDLKAGHWGALLIRSDVLGGEEVWVVRDEEQARALQTDGKAIYFAEEFAVLKTKTPEEIRDIHQAKLAFPGCRVVQ